MAAPGRDCLITVTALNCKAIMGTEINYPAAFSAPGQCSKTPNRKGVASEPGQLATVANCRGAPTEKHNCLFSLCQRLPGGAQSATREKWFHVNKR